MLRLCGVCVAEGWAALVSSKIATFTQKEKGGADMHTTAHVLPTRCMKWEPDPPGLLRAALRRAEPSGRAEREVSLVRAGVPLVPQAHQNRSALSLKGATNDCFIERLRLDGGEASRHSLMRAHPLVQTPRAFGIPRRE